MSGTKNEISTCSLTGDEYALTASVKPFVAHLWVLGVRIEKKLYPM